jgi:hypothetical protein
LRIGDDERGIAGGDRHTRVRQLRDSDIRHAEQQGDADCSLKDSADYVSHLQVLLG